MKGLPFFVVFLFSSNLLGANPPKPCSAQIETIKSSISASKPMKDLTDIGLYLQNITKIPLLSPEKEVELFQDLGAAEIRLFALLLSAKASKEIFQKYLDLLKRDKTYQNRALRNHTDQSFKDLELQLKNLVRKSFLNLNLDDRVKYLKDFNWSRAALNKDFLKNMITNRAVPLELLKDLSHESQKAIQEQVEVLYKTRDKIYTANLLLAISNAKRFKGVFLNYNVPFMDVISAANLGIDVAIDRFELQKGFKFSTAATPWIKNAIHDFLKIFKKNPKNTSLNTPINGGSIEFGDLIEGHNNDNPKQIFYQSHLLRDIQLLLQKIGEREREIIERRFGLNGYEPHGFNQIAPHLGVSKQRVQQLYFEAMELLRWEGTKQGLDP